MIRRLATLLTATPLALVAAPPASAAEACFMPTTEVTLEQGLRVPPHYRPAEFVLDSFVCSIRLAFPAAACGDAAGSGTVSWSSASADVTARWVGTTILLTGEAAGQLGISYDAGDCLTAAGATEFVIGGSAVTGSPTE